ncbi:MAG TPA: hypothetical protein VKZ59_07620 [Acidobacteriota bacterium]|nr:hypothetical protein [Acidobacteriota bacterium]
MKRSGSQAEGTTVEASPNGLGLAFVSWLFWREEMYKASTAEGQIDARILNESMPGD